MKHYRKPLAHSTNSHLNADRFICVLNLLTTVKYTATQQEDLRFINNALTSCLNAQHDEISRLREIEDFLTWTETDGNPSASNRG